MTFSCPTVTATSSDADVRLLIHFADNHPAARWYAVKAVSALVGAAHLIPPEWSETSRTNISVDGRDFRLPDADGSIHEPTGRELAANNWTQPLNAAAGETASDAIRAVNAERAAAAAELPQMDAARAARAAKLARVRAENAARRAQ